MHVVWRIPSAFEVTWAFQFKPTCREAFARCPRFILTRKVCFQDSSKFIARERELHSSHFPKIRAKFCRTAADMPLSSSSLIAVWADVSGLGWWLWGLAVSKHRALLKSCGLYMFIIVYQNFPSTSQIRWPQSGVPYPPCRSNARLRGCAAKRWPTMRSSGNSSLRGNHGSPLAGRGGKNPRLNHVEPFF